MHAVSCPEKPFPCPRHHDTTRRHPARRGVARWRISVSAPIRPTTTGAGVNAGNHRTSLSERHGTGWRACFTAPGSRRTAAGARGMPTRECGTDPAAGRTSPGREITSFPAQRTAPASQSTAPLRRGTASQARSTWYFPRRERYFARRTRYCAQRERYFALWRRYARHLMRPTLHQRQSTARLHPSPPRQTWQSAHHSQSNPHLRR